MNEYLCELLDEVQHNTRVRFVPYKKDKLLQKRKPGK